MKRIRFVYVALGGCSWRCSPFRRRVCRRAARCPRRSGAGEGKLTLVAWEGYTEKQWVAPFEKQTGCKVSAKYAGSSNDMFNLMTSGGGGQYDMVSASGDASLRLIYAGAVAEVERQPDPVLQGLLQRVQVAGEQHGRTGSTTASRCSSGRTCCSTTRRRYEEADELGRDLRPEEQGQDHDPRQPDPDRRRGALPLEDEAGARDQGPVRADEGPARRGRRPAQAAAAARQEVLGARVRPDRPLQERRLDASARRGRTSSNTLKAAKVPVAAVIPKEGVTGWLDTWMLSSKAKHPNCAYKWMQYITTPKAAGPAGDLLRRDAGQQEGVRRSWTRSSKGSCAQYSANAPGELLPVDQVLEDADRRLRQRQEELHGPPGVDDGLDADQGLANVPCRRTLRVSRRAPPRGSPPLSLAVLLAPARGSRRSGRSRLPSPRSCFVYVAALAALLIQGFWTTDSVHGEGRPLRGTSTTSARSRTRRTRRSSSGRSAIASAVTVTCMLLAFPYAYFLVRIAARRLRSCSSSRRCCRSGSATSCASTRGG